MSRYGERCKRGWGWPDGAPDPAKWKTCPQYIRPGSILDPTMDPAEAWARNFPAPKTRHNADERPPLRRKKLPSPRSDFDHPLFRDP